MISRAYASPATQAGQGRRAAQTLDRLVSGVSLTAAREKAQGPLHTDITGIAPNPRREPAGLTHTPEEAAQEAARCLQCQCLICVKECVYLQKYKGYPRVYARQAHNNASIVKGLHTANAMINGCALCGQCITHCPTAALRERDDTDRVFDALADPDKIVEIVLIVTGGRDRKEKKIKNKVKEGNALFFCL